MPRPRRLALMNLFLHGVEPHIYLGDTILRPRERGESVLELPQAALGRAHRIEHGRIALTHLL